MGWEAAGRRRRIKQRKVVDTADGTVVPEGRGHGATNGHGNADPGGEHGDAHILEIGVRAFFTYIHKSGISGSEGIFILGFL